MLSFSLKSHTHTHREVNQLAYKAFQFKAWQNILSMSMTLTKIKRKREDAL